MPKFVLDLPSAVVCTVQTRVNGTELFCLKTKPFRDDDLVVSLKVSDNYQSFKVYRSGEVYMGVVKDRGQTTSSAASKTASAASTMISRVVSKSKKFMVDKILLDKILTFKINYNSQGKIESVSIPPNTPIMRLISFVASGQKSLLEAKHAMDRSKVKFLASTFGSLEGVKVIYDVLFDTDVTASRWNEVGVTIYPDSARCGLDTCEPKEEEMPKHLLLQDVFDYIRPGALPPASAASADKAGAAARLVRRYVRKLARVLVASKHPEKRLRETIQDLEATDRPPQVKDARTGQLVLELKQEKGAVAQHVVGGLKAVSSLVTAAALYKGAAAYAASQRPRALRDLMFTPLGQGSGLMAAAGLSSVFLSNMTGKYGKALQGTRETCGELRSTIDAITKAPSNTVKELIPRPKAIGSMIGKVLQSHQIDDANYE